MQRTKRCYICDMLFITDECPHCVNVKKEHTGPSFPLLNGQIDTETLADFMVTKILVKLEVSCSHILKQEIQSDVKKRLDDIIDYL